MFLFRDLSETWRAEKTRFGKAAGCLFFLWLFCFLTPQAKAIVGSESGSTIFNGNYINDLLGAQTFYDMGFGGSRAVVANIEAGTIWGGHESLNGRVSQIIYDPTITGSSLGQADWHATMVGQAIGGSGNYTFQDGIAPTAQLWSAGIATSWNAQAGSSYSGSFNTTDSSFLYAYKTTMSTGLNIGGNVVKANVINSSWGFSDSAGRFDETMAIDALIKQNNVVAVFSAGNSGPAANTVGGPASAYNGISVGAMTGDTAIAPFTQLASFSSRGPGDFYNPATRVTTAGVRPVVDLVAPGDSLTLAFYGGVTGGHTSGTDPTLGSGGIYKSQYYIPDMGGTSFAAPVVAGAASLMVDAGKYFVSAGASSEMLDARVIKAALMAGATATSGWSNGQAMESGVITTRQGLDSGLGAGVVNLDRAYHLYVGDSLLTLNGSNLTPTAGGNTTLGVSGTEGGSNLAQRGWDLGTVTSSASALDHSNSYIFGSSLLGGSELTAALTWFADRSLGLTLDTAADISLSNLSLEFFRMDGVGGPSLVAQSITSASTAEFLRLLVPETGSYMLRVVGLDQNYNTASTPLLDTAYGLAWNVGPAPEPSTGFLLFLAGSVWLFWTSRVGKNWRKRKTVS